MGNSSTYRCTKEEKQWYESIQSRYPLEKKTWRNILQSLHMLAKDERSIKHMMRLLDGKVRDLKKPVHMDTKDSEGSTPLHVAAAYGNLKGAKLLLDRGSEALDEMNKYKWTPLHLGTSL